jgi:hypothetical protein
MEIINVNEMYDIKESKKLDDKLLRLYKEVIDICIKELEFDETLDLIEKSQNYLNLYEEVVPNEFKKGLEINFYYKDFKSSLEMVEQSIEILKKNKS